MSVSVEEFKPYPSIVRSIVIQELKECGWVELIRIPIGNPQDATPEGIQKAIESLENLFYESDKVELSVQGVQICIRGIEVTGRTFRIAASVEPIDEPMLVV